MRDVRPEPAKPPLRRDAQRNIERILSAAVELYGEEGLGASHEKIAQRAEVSVGTVYRRFPDREELIDALFEDQLQRLVTNAEGALSAANAWDGLVQFVEGTLESASANVGLMQLINGSNHGAERISRVRGRIEPLANAIMARAQVEGAVRADAELQDLPILQLMLSSLVDASRDVAAATWRRYLALFLDGLRPAGQPRPPLPKAPALNTIAEIIAASNVRR